MAKLSANSNYLLGLVCRDQSITVIANLPEKIDLTIEGDWESRFPHTSSDFVAWLPNTAQLLAKAALNLYGGEVMQQQLSILTWQGTSPVTINLELLFDAETDAFTDVVQPMVNLQRLAAPLDFGGGLLVPPGPSPANQNRNRNELYLGNFGYIGSVAITSVTNTFDTRMDENGHPISGLSQVNLKTMYVPSRDDVLLWFGLDSSGNPIGVASGSPPPFAAGAGQATAPSTVFQTAQ